MGVSITDIVYKYISFPFSKYIQIDRNTQHKYLKIDLQYNICVVWPKAQPSAEQAVSLPTKPLGLSKILSLKHNIKRKCKLSSHLNTILHILHAI